jgi:hypothetical protein
MISLDYQLRSFIFILVFIYIQLKNILEMIKKKQIKLKKMIFVLAMKKKKIGLDVSA